MTPAPGWDSVSLAREAISQLPAADEVEVWVHDAAEASCTLLPATGTTIATSGRAQGFGCRVWRQGRHAAQGRAVAGPADLAALLRETYELAGHSGTPRPVPAVARVGDGDRGLAPVLDAADTERAAQRVGRRLAALGGVVQAVVVNRYDFLAGPVTRSGSDAVQRMYEERVIVRVETPHGAVTDAVAGTVPAGDPDLAPMLRRLTDALETLAAPGGEAPADLPVRFRPAVAAPIVSGLIWLLSGTTAQEVPGLARAVGRRAFPPVLQVDDPGTAAGETLRVFDDDGQPVVPVELIQQGRLVGFLHSLETAHALGHRPNGRGFRMGIPTQPMPQPVRLRVRGGGPVAGDHLELSCRLDNLVTMPRPGRVELIVAGWVVRGGRRVARVAPFELGFDLLAYLRRLRAVGTDAEVMATASHAQVPSLIFRGLP